MDKKSILLFLLDIADVMFVAKAHNRCSDVTACYGTLTTLLQSTGHVYQLEVTPKIVLMFSCDLVIHFTEL